MCARMHVCNMLKICVKMCLHVCVVCRMCVVFSMPMVSFTAQSKQNPCIYLVYDLLPCRQNAICSHHIVHQLGWIYHRQ